MIDEKSMTVKASGCIRTLRLKVKAESYPWLNDAAVEVNQVWNWCNETSYKAARPFSGPGKWLSGFDLDKLAAGASECFEHIGSETIQRVNAEFALRRRQFQRAKLRWRVSRGTRRSLGWIPFKAAQLKRKCKSLRFTGRQHGITCRLWWLPEHEHSRFSRIPDQSIPHSRGVAPTDGEL